MDKQNEVRYGFVSISMYEWPVLFIYIYIYIYIYKHGRSYIKALGAQAPPVFFAFVNKKQFTVSNLQQALICNS